MPNYQEALRPFFAFLQPAAPVAPSESKPAAKTNAKSPPSTAAASPDLGALLPGDLARR